MFETVTLGREPERSEVQTLIEPPRISEFDRFLYYLYRLYLYFVNLFNRNILRVTDHFLESERQQAKCF